MMSNTLWSFCTILAVTAFGAAQVQPCNSSSAIAKRPNIIFIITDDQDLHMNSLATMPLLKKHMIDQGLSYSNHYCTVALCCPSRVSLLTGKAAQHLRIGVDFHSSNTNVTDVNPPYGGYPKFISQGLNDNYLPVWLQAAGYNTYYAGKLMNSQNINNYNQPAANGFNHSHFLLDPFTYFYTNSVWTENAGVPVQYNGQHTTDLTVARAYSLLDEAVAAMANRPFFLALAPIAPHFTPIFVNGTLFYGPPVPQDRYKNYFLNATVPRTANFNPDTPRQVLDALIRIEGMASLQIFKSGASWVKTLAKQSQANVDYNDAFYRARLQTLQGVDEMIDGLFSRLNNYTILNSTYIIYTTDNGFHIGQHRLQPGKSCPYEDDVNIPLIIRGPNVPIGETTDIVTTHTDLAPTFFKLLGITQRADFDGTAIPVTKSGLARAARKRAEHVNVEFWGLPIPEGIYAKAGVNNTYKALRLRGPFYNLYYAVWCTNEHELYDMTIDPYQMTNLLTPSSNSSSTTILGVPLANVAARLDALLFVLKSCAQSSCVEPWRVLHPEGDVENLIDALDSTFDNFYAKEQAKISFSSCELGYLVSAEGPQVASSYSSDAEWSWWT